MGVLLAMVGVLAFAATPAQADPYQNWYYAGDHSQGGTLRSSVNGSYYTYATNGTQGVGPVQLTITDRSADGYRARVWFNIYTCHCTSATYRARALHYDNTLGAGKSVSINADGDGLSSGAPSGTTRFYTVEIKVGRYDGDTGNYSSTTLLTKQFSLTTS
ncbi:hypothetical protein AB0J82_04605 [Asanoa sp. NPDC049518]|uniref:hypothetical protein n=1 Tax=unclassified Asanoa TaxID=2685164 RepID=UPI00344496EF